MNNVHQGVSAQHPTMQLSNSGLLELYKDVATLKNDMKHAKEREKELTVKLEKLIDGITDFKEGVAEFKGETKGALEGIKDGLASIKWTVGIILTVATIAIALINIYLK